MKPHEIHSMYLKEWMKPQHYKEAGLKLEDIVSVISEPIWIPNRNLDMHTLCDYIIIMEGNYAIPAELKHYSSQKLKAIRQIQAGKMYINNVLNMNCYKGLFLTYNEGEYLYQWIMLKK